jgi:glycosyltransferase involved in cell wall biosynthesis
LLTGEYAGWPSHGCGEDAPAAGGVGEYTRVLARELADRGHSVNVWTPAIRADRDDGVIGLRALPDQFGSGSRQVLQAAWDARPGTVLLQYVPNALGARGLNLGFCRWLRRAARGRDVRVMFHEPYFYFSWSPFGNLRAIVQRVMADVLVDAARAVYFSTATWRRYLPKARGAVVLPVPSTVPRLGDGDAAKRFRSRISQERCEIVGHFGTFGNHISGELERVIPLVLEGRPAARLMCIGRDSDRFASSIRARHASFAHRVHHTGALASADVAAAIRACDVMLQPYPDGITTRRTSVMASLTNGVPAVSTEGVLTEPVWREAGGVALAPAGDARGIASKVFQLLDDETARAALAAAGRRMYDTRFAIERSVDALLGV